MGTTLETMRKVLADIYADKFAFNGIEEYWEDNYPALHLAWLENSGWVSVNTRVLVDSMYENAFNHLLAGFSVSADEITIEDTQQLIDMVSV